MAVLFLFTDNTSEVAITAPGTSNHRNSSTGPTPDCSPPSPDTALKNIVKVIRPQVSAQNDIVYTIMYFVFESVHAQLMWQCLAHFMICKLILEFKKGDWKRVFSPLELMMDIETCLSVWKNEFVFYMKTQEKLRKRAISRHLPFTTF